MTRFAEASVLDRGWQAFYRATYLVLRVCWRLRPRDHQGALVAIYVDGKVLVVRSSYRPGWSFPGGGIDPGETPPAAASRELREELGLEVAITGSPVVISGVWEGRPDTVHIFDLVLPAAPALRLDNREVIGARFVGLDELSRMALTGPVRAYLDARSLPPEHQHTGA